MGSVNQICAYICMKLRLCVCVCACLFQAMNSYENSHQTSRNRHDFPPFKWNYCICKSEQSPFYVNSPKVIKHKWNDTLSSNKWTLFLIMLTLAYLLYFVLQTFMKCFFFARLFMLDSFVCVNSIPYEYWTVYRYHVDIRWIEALFHGCRK